MNLMNKTATPENEKRQYIRLPGMFPVEFTMVYLQGEALGLEWQQGFTSNVSKGGLCLQTIHINEPTIKFLAAENICLDLHIHIPLSLPPIRAVSEVAWFQKLGNQSPQEYLVGLKFRLITQKDIGRILAQARIVNSSTRAAIAVSIVLFLALIGTGFHNYKLRLANEALIGNFLEIQHEENKANQSLTAINQEKQALLGKIQKFSEEIDSWKRQAEALEQRKQLNETDKQEELQQKNEEIGALKNQIEILLKEKIPLENQYARLLEHETQTADRLRILEQKKAGLQESVLEKMHLWLKNHQNPTTGLILSFEGNVGAIKDWAFAYDQALAANVFLIFNNVDGAKRILNFFNKKLTKDFQGFYNAYYYDSGEAAEFTTHSGPNIWVGIAALQYTHKTKDSAYLNLAKSIADWLITLQDRDPAGGLKGGPQFSWFATEHNLDAYAFFGMLYRVTNEKKYRIAQEKVLSWLVKYAMIPHDQDYKSPPINRGKGDSTIATDTFAWSLAALGPQVLIDKGMDPEQIMQFAQDNCAVKVRYKRPSGVMVEALGFDFSKPAHVARGGLISPEWTSQMIVSYRMLAGYFLEKNDMIKAGYYTQKATLYLNELNKLLIASLSVKGQGEGCLPYATLENADTGHGWHTPSGLSTCSVAGTAYMIMAVKKFNPLMFQELP